MNTKTDNTKQHIPTSPELRKAQCDIARVLDLLLKRKKRNSTSVRRLHGD